MFQGAVSLSLDVKGRLAIPSKHREMLMAAGEGSLVLTAHPHRCLLLYPAPLWEPVSAEIGALSSFDVKTAPVKRVMLGNAVTIEPDAAGRLLIAPDLRGYAQLEKTVFLVGMGTHFEIWSESGWQQQNALAVDVFATDLPDALVGLSL